MNFFLSLFYLELIWKKKYNVCKSTKQKIVSQNMLYIYLSTDYDYLIMSCIVIIIFNEHNALIFIIHTI